MSLLHFVGPYSDCRKQRKGRPLLPAAAAVSVFFPVMPRALGQTQGVALRFYRSAFFLRVRRVSAGTPDLPMPDANLRQFKPAHAVESVRKLVWFEGWQPNISGFNGSEA